MPRSVESLNNISPENANQTVTFNPNATGQAEMFITHDFRIGPKGGLIPRGPRLRTGA